MSLANLDHDINRKQEGWLLRVEAKHVLTSKKALTKACAYLVLTAFTVAKEEHASVDTTVPR